MTAKEILDELQRLGTETTQKIYLRNGAQEKVFGTSYAHIGQIAKRIKRDHQVALKLWDSGYMEARVIACQLADPELTSADVLARWSASLGSSMDADNLAALAATTAAGLETARSWIKSKDTNVRRAGFSCYGSLLRKGTPITAADQRKLLAQIEKEIHKAPDLVKESMNYLLITIGYCSDELREEALAAAKRIGKVEIDHGETNCKTPDAYSYILKTVEHRAKKASGRA